MYDQDFVKRLEALVRGATGLWSLPATTEVSLVNLSENATWLLEDAASGRRSVLRVHRPRYHSEQEIRSELAWISALARQGVVSTPAPIVGRDGAVLQTLHDADEIRHAVLFEHAEGAEPSPSDDLPEWFRRLGEVSASLHRHARSWEAPSDFSRKCWDFDAMIGDRPIWGDWRKAVGLTQEGRRLLHRGVDMMRQRLAVYGSAPARFGLIHADLRLANLLISGDRLTVIDFDDCGLGWFLYDFASAVSFFESDPIVPLLAQRWMEGYRSVATLSPEDEAILPTLILLRRVLLLAWVASHQETATAQAYGRPYTEGALELAESYLSKSA